jgi:hypothetical protein
MWMPEILHQENDPECLRQAIEALQALGHQIRRPSPYQLKVGRTNFWPTTGVIAIDPGLVQSGRGLSAFLEILAEEGPPIFEVKL